MNESSRSNDNGKRSAVPTGTRGVRKSGVWVCDLETDGLLDTLTRVWCLAVRGLDTREEFFFGPDEIEDGLAFLSGCEVVVFHNGFGFDYPVLKRLFGWDHPAKEDSLVLSKLYSPERKGGHSIEAWGEKFGIPKPPHEDWSQFSEEMRHRCIEDTRIGTRVVRTLIEESKGQDWRDVIRLEYDVSELQARIQERGVRLDVEAAEQLLVDLEEEIEQKLQELQAVLPYVATPKTATDKKGGVKKPFKADGSLSKACSDWIGDDDVEVMGQFCRVEWVQINPSSAAQIKPCLLYTSPSPRDS